MKLARLPSTNALISFEAAARLLSFKEAANELSVTPGAISQQIRGLEEHLGVALFNRNARSVTLTKSGLVLSQSVSDSLHSIEEALTRITTDVELKLRINATAAVVAKILLPRINDFSDRFSNLEIGIETQTSLNAMHHDGPDVALRTTNAPPTDLHSVLLHNEFLLPVASPDLIQKLNLRTAADMENAPLLNDISLTRFVGAPDWSNWFKAVGLECLPVESNIHFEGGAPDFLVDMAIAGSGVLLGRSSLVYSALSSGQLACPFGPVLPTNIGIYALCRKDKRAHPSARAFIDWLKKEFALMSTINALHSALNRTKT